LILETFEIFKASYKRGILEIHWAVLKLERFVSFMQKFSLLEGQLVLSTFERHAVNTLNNLAYNW